MRDKGYSRKARALAHRGYRVLTHPYTVKAAKAMAYAGAAYAPAWAYNKVKSYFGRSKGKSIHQRAVNVGTGGSMSKFFYGKRKIPRRYASVYKALAKNYVGVNTAQRITAGIGLQNAYTVMPMFNSGDVASISSKVANNNTNKIFLSSCSAEVMLTNQELANVRIYIYDIIARRDSQSNVNTQNPDTAWKNSYADEGGANSNYSIVGSTPYSSDLFTQYFKVLKVTHLTLSQGQSHTHRVHYSPNRAIDGEYIQYNSGSFKGLTCFTMIVLHGYPENDSTTKTQVSTGQCDVDVIIRKQYKYTWLNDQDTTFSMTNNLPANFTVGESIVNIGAGSVATDSNA